MGLSQPWPPHARKGAYDGLAVVAVLGALHGPSSVVPTPRG